MLKEVDGDTELWLRAGYAYLDLISGTQTVPGVGPHRWHEHLCRLSESSGYGDWARTPFWQAVTDGFSGATAVAGRLLAQLEADPRAVNKLVWWKTVQAVALDAGCTPPASLSKSELAERLAALEMGDEEVGCVYLGVGFRGERLSLVYTGRTNDEMRRSVQHLLGISKGQDSTTLFYQEGAMCDEVFIFSLLEHRVDAKGARSILCRAIMEGVRCLLLGSNVRRESLNSYRCDYGLPNLGHDVVGCNATVCFEAPEAEEGDDEAAMQVQNATYRRALRRVRLQKDCLETLTGHEDQVAVQRQEVRVTEARSTFYEVYKQLMRSRMLLFKPKLNDNNEHGAPWLGLKMPKAFIAEMQGITGGEKFFLGVEVGEDSSVGSASEEDRRFFKNVMVTGRFTDSAETRSVVWRNDSWPLSKAARDFFTRAVNALDDAALRHAAREQARQEIVARRPQGYEKVSILARKGFDGRFWLTSSLQIELENGMRKVTLGQRCNKEWVQAASFRLANPDRREQNSRSIYQ